MKITILFVLIININLITCNVTKLYKSDCLQKQSGYILRCQAYIGKQYCPKVNNMQTYVWCQCTGGGYAYCTNECYYNSIF